MFMVAIISVLVCLFLLVIIFVISKYFFLQLHNNSMTLKGLELIHSRNIQPDEFHVHSLLNKNKLHDRIRNCVAACSRKVICIGNRLFFENGLVKIQILS